MKYVVTPIQQAKRQKVDGQWETLADCWDVHNLVVIEADDAGVAVKGYIATKAGEISNAMGGRSDPNPLGEYIVFPVEAVTVQTLVVAGGVEVP